MINILLFFLTQHFPKQNDPLIKFSPFNQKVQGSTFFSNFFKLKTLGKKGFSPKRRRLNCFLYQGEKWWPPLGRKGLSCLCEQFFECLTRQYMEKTLSNQCSYTIQKLSKCKCVKWSCILNLGNELKVGKKKNWESNFQVPFYPKQLNLHSPWEKAFSFKKWDSKIWYWIFVFVITFGSSLKLKIQNHLRYLCSKSFPMA
jgi:hypothetical protein